jgi:hypothetical protein
MLHLLSAVACGDGYLAVTGDIIVLKSVRVSLAVFFCRWRGKTIDEPAASIGLPLIVVVAFEILACTGAVPLNIMKLVDERSVIAISISLLAVV